MSVMPRGVHQIAGRTRPVRTAPATMKGLRRPQRVRVLSERFPVTWSQTASHSRQKVRMKPEHRRVHAQTDVEDGG